MRRSVLYIVAAAATPIACAPSAPPELALDPGSSAWLAYEAEAERKSWKMETHSSYDRITGRTTVTLELLDLGKLAADGLRLDASFSYPGDTLLEEPTEVLFTVDWPDYGGSTEYLESPSAYFLADDSLRFEARGRDFRSYVTRTFFQAVMSDSTFRQRVTLVVARGDFERMTEARIVEGKLTTGTEFRLSLQHLIALRRLEERMHAQ